MAWGQRAASIGKEDAACTANEFEYDGAPAKDAAEHGAVADDKCAKGEAQVLGLCRLAVYVSWTGTDKEMGGTLYHNRTACLVWKIPGPSLVSSLGKEAVACNAAMSLQH